MSVEGVVLFGSFAALLLLGAPIYVSLGGSALLTIVVFDLAPLQVLPGTVRSSFNSFTLLAVPLFILAGELLARSEIAVRLIDVARAIVGRVRGGLAIVSVIVGVFFAGISGSGPADVAAQGTILYPAMVRDNYPRPFAAALQAACGGLGIIIPPSIALVLYGVVTDTSIGRLLFAGIIPGLIIASTIAIISVVLARRHGWGPAAGAAESGPAAGAAESGLDAVDASGLDAVDASGPTPGSAFLGPDSRPRRSDQVDQTAQLGRFRLILRAFRRAAWGLFAPIIILGGLYGGIFTPTEAAAVVAIYALFVGMLIYRDLNFRSVGTIFVSSARTSGMVMIIVASASVFAFLLNSQGIARDFATLLIELSSNTVVALLIVNLILLLADCFLDTVSMYFIFVPLLLPVVTAFGVDPVHFGIITTVNLAIGQVSPPVGVNLFVACAISGVSLLDISKAVIPLAAAQVAGLLLITYVPALSLWLPNLLGV